MFPRGPKVLSVIQDGRWKLEPNPVAWTIMPQLAKPVGLRRHPDSGVTAILSTPVEDGFALAMPHQSEGHYSIYLSLFGRDLPAGRAIRAQARMIITQVATENELLPVIEGMAK